MTSPRLRPPSFDAHNPRPTDPPGPTTSVPVAAAIPLPDAGTSADGPADRSAELPASVAAALAAGTALGDAGPGDAGPPPAAVEAVMRAVRARPVPARPVPAPAVAPPGGSVNGRYGRRRSAWRRGVIAASIVAVAASAATAWARRSAPRGAGEVADQTARARATRTDRLDGAPSVGEPAGSIGAAAPARFAVLAPAARRVAVVGDFNNWDGAATPMRYDAAAGLWTARLALPAGRYVYAYLVDGARWMADPNAPLAPADGFGRQSSVLVVGTQVAVR